MDLAVASCRLLLMCMDLALAACLPPRLLLFLVLGCDACWYRGSDGVSTAAGQHPHT